MCLSMGDSIDNSIKIAPVDDLLATHNTSPDPTTAHWAKNRGQKDINSKIVEKGKIINFLCGFQSPFMNQNHLKDFCYRF